MSSIFIHLHGWGSGGTALQRAFSANSAALLAGGLAYTSTAYEPCVGAKTHQAFYQNLLRQRQGHSGQPSEGMEAALADWRRELAAGRNVLVSIRPANMGKTLLRLHSLFSRAPGFEHVEKKYFLMPGRPDAALEEFRQTHPASGEIDPREAARLAGSLAALVRKAPGIAGAGNVVFHFPQLLPCGDNGEEMARLLLRFRDFALKGAPLPLPCEAAAPWRQLWVRQVLDAVNNAWGKPGPDVLARELAPLAGPEGAALRFSAQGTLDAMTALCRSDWEEAATLAGEPHAWRELPSPPAGGKPFAPLAGKAPQTLAYLAENRFLLPPEWQDAAARILAEGARNARERPRSSRCSP